MLGDTNRTRVFVLPGPFGANVVGSGSDGSTYWNIFNVEGESSIAADIVTYGTLLDMLGDSNRTGVFALSGAFGVNVVGGGASISAASSIPEPSALARLGLSLGLVVVAARTRQVAPSKSRAWFMNLRSGLAG